MSAKVRIPWIEKVALAWESEACLLWPFSIRGGRKGEGGYPALNGTYGHVYLCELIYGPRPVGKEVEHTCGEKLCMNRSHLRWATHKENCARRTEHGTQTIGEKHPGSKLSEHDVSEIRSSEASGVDLANKFNVSTATISLVRNGKLWRHLLEDE